MDKIAVIILQYNKSNLTIDCLSSMKEHECVDKFDIFVVDNNSLDSEYEAIESYRDRNDFFNIIRMEKNYGFGVAHNILINSISNKFVVLLNNDTLLIDNAITKISEYYLNNDCDFCTGTLLNTDKSYQENSAGYFYFPHPLIRLSNAIKNNLLKGSVTRINYVNGAFFMISKELFLKAGGFSKNIFMYGEDLDFMIKLNLMGFNNGIKLNNTRIIHIGGASSLQKWNNKEKSRLQISQGNCIVKQHYGKTKNFVFAMIAFVVTILSVNKLLFSTELYKNNLLKSIYRLTQ
ncbi:glycosyltransferase [Vibrio sp. JC009]|uniref:glycosyltransferase family 2 protein n=1 Tax=Vibrio sp. JC009 TaxID=2912314 RepID=UPI0023AEE0D9|nr:glycosyltransferase [Vibrio sp. JC009]WED20643.1 glycosyltransferase [Vibrio sp. JC009]